MSVFNTKLLKNQRNKIANNFKNFNFLKKELAIILLERLDVLTIPLNLALDINAETGEVAEILENNNKIEKLIQIDNSCNMLLNNNYNNKICADLTSLPFKENTFNLVVSVLGLHNINNFKEALQEVYRVLKPSGLFLASIPKNGNLSNLSNVLLNTDIKYNNKVYNRVHPFLSMQTIGNTAFNIGFKDVITDKEELTIMYKNIFNIFKDLKGMGASNVLLNKSSSVIFNNKYLSILKQEFEKIKDTNNNHFPINIEVCNLIAWKL